MAAVSRPLGGTVTLAGVPLRGTIGWVPTSGDLGLGVAIFSYAGNVTIGLCVDRGLVPDVRSLLDDIASELDAVLPDAILLDWMLPGQSGLVLARKWRGDSRTKGVPILMLTARGAEPDKVAGLEAGVAPFEPENVTGAPFILREAEAASRILTISSPSRPPVSG